MEAPVFEKIYNDYISEVASIDFVEKASLLGIKVDKKTILIPFFDKIFTITPEGISDPQGKKPHHAVSVILCKYLLLCQETVSLDCELVTYKDFRAAAPYVGGFRNTAEKPIINHFSGKIAALEKCCGELGGNASDIGVSAQLSYVFRALPKIPVYLLFNDQDDEFPADCSILFEKRAGRYLDMECLAMTGMALAQGLIKTYG